LRNNYLTVTGHVHAGFNILTAVTTRNKIFWDVIRHSVVIIYQ